MITIAVYLLCAMSALSCCGLLLRAYLLTKTRLLLWSTVCFAGLTLNNILVVIDLIILPSEDLSIWRTVTALAGVSALLYGLIWEGRK